jgi:peptide deformylase
MKTIVQDGTPVLREKAKPVPKELFGSEELSSLITDMSEALDKEEDGVALAAPQIGRSLRLFIVRMDRTIPPLQPDTVSVSGSGEPAAKPQVLAPQVDVYINPEIIKRSRKKQDMEEGCLSVRGIYGHTMRHERATIRAKHEDGSTFERGAGGLLAQIFEHEVDHLNGILFTDHAKNLVEIPPHEHPDLA